MGYVRYNTNPVSNLVGDCVVRAISMARAYPLEAFSFTKKDLPDTSSVTRDEYNKLVKMIEEQKKLLEDLTK